MVEIREEQSHDIPAIRDVNTRAFGQEQEANIVDALRANGAALLSLVATVEKRVVAHIMFSPVVVGGALTGAALGPMAVLPEHQRQGIGSMLVEEGIRRLTQSTCAIVIVVGHPAFYPRFGFRPASSYGIVCEWDVPEEAFMALVLDEAKMKEASGLAKYRAEFSTIA